MEEDSDPLLKKKSKSNDGSFKLPTQFNTFYLAIFIVSSIWAFICILPIIVLIFFAIISAALGLTIRESFLLYGMIPIDSSRRSIKTIDWVYAVNTCPSVGYGENKKLGKIWNSKYFNLTLDTDYPWILIFIDSSKIGSNMIQYMFKAKEINTIYSTLNGSSVVDLGTLVLNGDNRARLSNNMYNNYISSLGLSMSNAEYLSTIDSTTLRYSNPDIDGDGVIDLKQTDLPEINMWIWVHYIYGPMSINYLTNYVKKKLEIPSTTIPLKFVYTGPELSFNGITDNLDNLKEVYKQAPEKWILRWSDNGQMEIDHAVYNSEYSGGVDDPYNTMIFDYINDPTTNSHINFKITFDYDIINPPEGTYTYEFYMDETSETPDEILTFTHVNLPENTEQTNGYVFPFPIFMTDAKGKIIGYSYEWKKYVKTESKFIKARKEDIEMRLGRNLAQIKWCDEIGGTDGCDELNIDPYKSGYKLKSSVKRDSNHNGRKIPLKDIIQLQISYTTISGMTIKIMIEDSNGNTHGFFP